VRQGPWRLEPGGDGDGDLVRVQVKLGQGEGNQRLPDLDQITGEPLADIY
jgi:hypothetical protein